MLKGVSKISVLKVAEEAGWQTPKILIWREPAQKIRPVFLTKLKESGLVCEMDFSGIETADGSFIDEFLVTELRKIDAGQTDKKMIYLSKMNDTTIYNAELVFTKKRPPKEKFFILVDKGKSGWTLFSEGLEASLQETLNMIMEKKKITSNDVAKKFNISVPAASVRLKNLFDLRLIFRTEETTTTGMEFIYEALF
jgi:DNA-binding Lrp family transcriptional regulator